MFDRFIRAVMLCLLALPFCSGAVMGERLISPGDQLEITVWSDKDMSRTATVSEDGRIVMPLTGAIKVSGMDEDAAARLLAGHLVHYIIKPQVSVGIIKTRPDRVFVLGHVKNPGMYEIRRGSTLLEGISQAGGLLEKADLQRATVMRGGKYQKVNLNALLADGRISENLTVADGDVIVVPQRAENTIYVLGKVNNPGLYQVEDTLTVMGAVARAGGALDRGSLKKVAVIRGSISNPERIEVNLQQVIEKGDKSRDIALKAGDTVFVPEVGSLDWDKLLQRVWIFSVFRDLWR